MSDLRLQFGKRLRFLRRQQDLTQEELAERTGVSVDFISLMERGINFPSSETVERLSTALNIPIRDLFDFPEESSE